MQNTPFVLLMIKNALAGHTKSAFTIPLMKKTGYSDAFSESVEATASVGGQLLPPIMGAAAFIMVTPHYFLALYDAI